MASENKKILLIDGYSIASRAFYGLPLLSNSKGLHTNAILGFLNILLNTFTLTDPDYVTVAFDARKKTFRHEMYEAYKGTRKGMPDELHEQIPVLKDVLESMHIKTVTAEGYEADDILGTLSKKAEEDGLDVVILSGDRDLLQLATDKTMIAIPKTTSKGSETYTYFAKDVLEQYQVTPEEFIDLKALMGDSSDNIPGIPGIGEKRATDIIVKYKSIENAFEHADEITPPKVRESLVENYELGILSKKLATIVKDVPLDVDLYENEFEDSSLFFNDNSYELYKELELKKLLTYFDEKALVKEKKTQDKIEYELFSFGDLNEKAKDIADKCGFYVDKDLSLAAICDDKKTYLFENRGVLSISDIQSILTSFLFSGKEIYLFDLKEVLHALEVKDKRSDAIYDISVMAYLLNPIGSDYSYDIISQVYLNSIIPSESDLLKKLSVKEALSDDETKEAAQLCAAYNASAAFNAFPVLYKQIEEAEMDELLNEVEIPLIYSIYYMEKEGIAVNKEILNKLSAQLEDMIEADKADIFKEAGEEFNINSPKQLGVILFEKLKLPAGKKTKTGYSTSAEVLEKLAVEFPFVSKILKYRSEVKLKSNYTDGLVDYISEDGRIHGRFNQTVTATGRISSSDPNLQNIPTRTELGQEIRKAFVAKEGHVLIDADYSQIELRLMAHLSGDENLIEAYKSDADIHKITASKVFKTPLDEVTKEQRRNAKAVNFGIIYGISSFGLSKDLSISRKEAEGYISEYFKTYPKVKEYLDNTIKHARLNGYTTTMFNRRRPIPELTSSNGMIRAFGERAAMNAPIQGSAADIMKIAMINVDKRLRDEGLEAKIVLQVHDELLIEAPLSEKEEAKKIITEEMSKAAYTKVPLVVECNEATDWFEAH